MTFRARFINEANCQLATPFDMTKANYDYQIGKAREYDDYIKRRSELEPLLESDDFATVKKAQDALAKLEERT